MQASKHMMSMGSLQRCTGLVPCTRENFHDANLCAPTRENFLGANLCAPETPTRRNKKAANGRQPSLHATVEAKLRAENRKGEPAGTGGPAARGRHNPDT